MESVPRQRVAKIRNLISTSLQRGEEEFDIEEINHFNGFPSR
jgi:hypothetical protein